MSSAAYVLVHDVAASWEGYRAIEERLARPPAGLLVHVAGATDEGFRIVEIWQSVGAWQHHAAAFEAALRSVDPAVIVHATARELRAQHVVVGDEWAGRYPATTAEGTTREPAAGSAGMGWED